MAYSSLFPQPKQSNNAPYQASIGLPNPYQQAAVQSQVIPQPGQVVAPNPYVTVGTIAGAVGNYGQPGSQLGDIARLVQQFGQPTNPAAVSTVVPQAPMAPIAPAPVIDPNADAARLFAGSVAGNPFISPEGLARLHGGLVPDLNMINPAFYQYTSPVIQQALQGLYTTRGVRPEDVAFAQNLWRPGGLR